MLNVIREILNPDVKSSKNIRRKNYSNYLLQPATQLSEIVENFALSFKLVDENTTTQRSSRSGSGAYIPCVGLMETTKYATLGQITEALFNVGGKYRRNL